jgi:polyhydroxyalkanoate synthase
MADNVVSPGRGRASKTADAPASMRAKPGVVVASAKSPKAKSSKASKVAVKVAEQAKIAPKATPAKANGSKPPSAAAKTAEKSAQPKTVSAKPAAKAKAPPKPKPAPPKPAPSVNPKIESAAKPEPPPKPQASQADAQAREFDPLAFLNPSQREALEHLSVNLAKAALTAQGAVAEAALRQADRPAALTPDPFHVGPSLGEVMSQLANHPENLMRAQANLFERYLDLWSQAAKRASGETAPPVVEPARGDKRFADPAWSNNPVFEVMKQSYLITSNWLNDLVAAVDGVDPMTKRRVEFFTKTLTDAFAPSNFLVSNPSALREAMATHGESLLRGAEHFAQDLARGNGQLAISQTDFEQFKIGENIATAPGKVVYRSELFELLQFDPTTEQVYEIPLLIFPPWINKYYILDLRPNNSMVRWLASQGFTVFVVSWVNPDRHLAERTFEDYMREGIFDAVLQTSRQCGVETVNTVGYCIGGTLLGCALAFLAAKDNDAVNSATFFAAQQDFSEAGDLLLFTNEEWLQDLERRMDEAGGVLPGSAMAETFNSLRANDLVWSFFVNNYLMGREPTPFDLLFWNSDQTRMPKVLHLQYLRWFYQKNLLAKGELEMAGETLDLGKVKIPVFVQSSRDDHIAPMASVYKGAKLFGGPTTFMLAGSGHIAGVINAPAANKYQHWTNDQLPATLDEWRASAVEEPGSWWPRWAEWLADKSGKKVPARDPAKGPLQPLGDTPGTYVKVRSEV